MKTSKILFATAIVLMLSVNNFASAENVLKQKDSFNVAVVDIQKVVESSPAVSALKTDRKNKIDDLTKFVEKAKADVAKESDATKKKALEDSYNKELNTKKDAIDRDYVKKLAEIDNGISFLIKSKTTKYDLVLTKGVVLNGGTDVTAEIIKGLK